MFNPNPNPLQNGHRWATGTTGHLGGSLWLCTWGRGAEQKEDEPPFLSTPSLVTRRRRGGLDRGVGRKDAENRGLKRAVFAARAEG